MKCIHSVRCDHLSEKMTIFSIGSQKKFGHPLSNCHKQI